MGEVERVSVTHNFDSARERSASSMNTKTAWDTHIGTTLAFFAANVASERDPPPKGSQWVIVEFGFKFQNSTFHVKVEVATVTAISVRCEIHYRLGICSFLSLQDKQFFRQKE